MWTRGFAISPSFTFSLHFCWCPLTKRRKRVSFHYTISEVYVNRNTFWRKTATNVPVLWSETSGMTSSQLSAIRRESGGTLQTVSMSQKQKQTPWSESASELYRPSDRRISAKWLPTFADKGCQVVSVRDPYGRILGFLGRSRYFSIK
jgi:hypothetical protein